MSYCILLLPVCAMANFIILCGVFALINGLKHQIPQPRDPYTPVIYPEDYCSNLSPKSAIEFDFVVVGGGPAGAIVGRRLAEDPSTTVLILEAGGDPPPDSDIPTKFVDGSALWNITTVYKMNQCLGYIGDVCHYANPKYLGGCTVTSYMMYVRGNSRDYNEWEERGCPGWGYKNMLNYFRKLENFQDPRGEAYIEGGYHAFGGPFTTSPSQVDPLTYPFQLTYNQALRNLNIPENFDPNGRYQVGFGKITGSLEVTGYRNNVAKAYLLNIPDNLKICKHSLVQKVAIDALLETKTVTGVEFFYNGTCDKRIAIAKKEYILAGGPISSPQILERSGVGRKEVLEKVGVKQILELPGVGENLQEQFSNLGCAFSLNLNNAVAPNPLSISPLDHVMFLNLSDPLSLVPDTQWIYAPFKEAIVEKKMKPEILKQYREIKRKKRFILFASTLVLRQSTPGYVHIASTNPKDSPLFQPNQYTSNHEKKLLGQGCRLVRKAMKDSILAKYDPKPIVLKECKQYVFNSDDEIMCGASQVGYPLNHLVGTTKMGPACDSMAVVDPLRLKVYGIDNLRIVDLGIAPCITRGNTQVPSMAVAERAADLIKRDYVTKPNQFNMFNYLWDTNRI